MAEEVLYVIDDKIDIDLVPEISLGRKNVVISDTGEKADFSELERIIGSLSSSSKKAPKLDLKVFEVLHKSLGDKPKKILLSDGFWNWLSIIRFPEFVLKRWFDGDWKNFRKAKKSTKRRFFGGKTIGARNRNSFSRLFFTCDTLVRDESDYRLVQSMFENQDRHLAIFDREFCMSEKIARVLAEHIKDLSGKKSQEEIKKFNQLASGFAVDILDSESLMELLNS